VVVSFALVVDDRLLVAPDIESVKLRPNSNMAPEMSVLVISFVTELTLRITRDTYPVLLQFVYVCVCMCVVVVVFQKV
jgi:hypothetical protein